MLLLRIMLTICALYGLYRLADDTPAAEQTAYLPIGVRRVWSVLGLALTLAFWFWDAWWVLIPALAAHLAAMICRNACIRWDKKRIHISGMMGLRWDYEYAQVRYLPGKLPLLITNNRMFVLWPGMVWRDTFIEEAREHVRVAGYSQIYRKRAYKDTRHNAASRNAMMSNLGIALLLGALFAYLYWPITADTGEVVELTLVEAWERGDDLIGLDFTDAEDYRLALNNTTRALLEPDAVGQTYTVQRKYRVSGGRYHRSTWYNVVAIQGADGTVYRTWQQSAASVDRARPYGLASMALLWFMTRKHSPKRRR